MGCYIFIFSEGIKNIFLFLFRGLGVFKKWDRAIAFYRQNIHYKILFSED